MRGTTDPNSSKVSQRETTPGGLRQVNHLFERMYSNLNSLRLPGNSQQQMDENLLDDISSFKDKVQVRDFSEYLKPKKNTKEGVSPLTKPQQSIQQPDVSPQPFSPKHATNKPNNSHFKQSSQLNALLTQRDSQIVMLHQRIKELEVGNRQSIAQLQSKFQQHIVNNEREQQQQYQSTIQATRIKQLEDEVLFLTQNNQHLYRSSVKLTEQLDKLKADLEAKNTHQSALNQKIMELEKNLAAVKKINKQLLREQTNIVKTSEEEATLFKTVKEEFEKENALLKKKVQFLEVERNTSINALKSISNGSGKYFSSMTHRPGQSQDSSAEMSKMRHEIELIKSNLNSLSVKKTGGSTGKISRVTPVRKSQWKLE